VSSHHLILPLLRSNVLQAEILHSPPLTQLPKNILRAPPRSPDTIAPEFASIYNSLPLPSNSHVLLQPDQRFIDSENFTNKFATHLSGSTERVNRRLMRRWSELETDWLDLGAVLNGFSLGEQPGLAEGIEKTGQAIDASYSHTNAMV
jgi:sorting nexin-41/42